jgi:hypothetical protein
VTARFRFLLVSTVPAHEATGSDLARLVRSLDDQGVDIELHLVVRGALEPDTELPPVPPEVGRLIVHGAPTSTGLSRARNIALLEAWASGAFDRADAVAFPDDDCWYPPRLLAHVAHHLADWDIVMGSYSESAPEPDYHRFPPEGGELGWRVAYEQTASVTQFYRPAAVLDVGLFDERFGVGASYPSAEDADFLVRSIAAGRRCLYEPTLVVGHRQLGGEYDHHYLGGTAVLAKHALRVAEARRLLARRLLAGARQMTSGAMRAREYASTLRAVVATLGRSA